MKIIKFAEDRQTFLFKAEKQLTMTDSEESSKETSKVEIEIDMITGTAAAMLYSDEEIRDVFSKEDADEFIELRRQVREKYTPKEYELGNNDEELPMAAEEESGY
jgi:hypothetical protein